MILFEARASIILYNVLKSIRPKKKFILPLNICPIVPAIFLKAKVKFEFIDISLDNLCMNQELLLDKIYNEDVGGVLFVKTFGIELDTRSLFKKIKKINREIFIIDDCCLQIPKFDYDIESSYADLAIFSTGYSKYVDIGWGGFGFLNDRINYQKNYLIFYQKDLESFTSETQKCINNNCLFQYKDNFWLGSNEARYDDFTIYKNAIIKKVQEIKEHKELLNSVYKKNLPAEIQLGDRFSNWRFSILVENKEDLLKDIFDAGLFASSQYKEVDYMYKKNAIKNSNAQKIHKRIINLFNDFRFTLSQANQIVEIINKNLQESKL